MKIWFDLLEVMSEVISEVNELWSDYFLLSLVGIDLKNSSWKFQLSISFRCRVIKDRIAYQTDPTPFSLTVLLMKESPTLNPNYEAIINTREKTKPVLKSAYPRLHFAPFSRILSPFFKNFILFGATLLNMYLRYSLRGPIHKPYM